MQYMLTILIKDGVDEKNRVAILDSIKKSFDELKKEDLWGSRSLAYPINHQTKAYYANYEFELDPSKVLSLDRSLKLNEDIIRYLLTKVEIKKVKPNKKTKRIIGAKAEEAKEEVSEEQEAVIEAA